ncbi:MAG: hypothetical protein AAF696_34730 [Bacteroidota bacterium]
MSQSAEHVSTSDIDLFWKVYDEVIEEEDFLKQVSLVDSLYLQKGSDGLKAMVEVRNYQAAQYVGLINRYPKFWESIRENTLSSKSLSKDLEHEIEKLKKLYPDLKPAKIYFVVGAMKSNGTTKGNAVLIGAELAMGSPSIDISEFEGKTKNWLEGFFGTNPIEAVTQLNAHEYVHTQQGLIPEGLLYQCLYEGIAEFISVRSSGKASQSPAIEFGENNPAVRQKFEREMFYNRTFEWLWNDTSNEFEIRDLGYYIGYAIAEKYYKQSKNKQAAIKELIEIDYADKAEANKIIDASNYFSKDIASLKKADTAKRPRVVGIKELEGKSELVPATSSSFTIVFSEALNGVNYGLNYSELGRDAFPELLEGKWSEDKTQFIVEVKLKPKSNYKFWLTEGFQNEEGIPILPYLIEFRTSAD